MAGSGGRLCCSNTLIAAAAGVCSPPTVARLEGFPQQEVVTADGNFSIDIAAETAAGVRLAVEVDGPYHFVSPGNKVNGRTPQYKVDGPTQYRNRALAARGYTVVRIPWWEWEQQKGNKARMDHLQRKLSGMNVVADCNCILLLNV
jgi:very-short-patch-repair endonuclease